MRSQDLESAHGGISDLQAGEQTDYEYARRLLEAGTSPGALAVEAAVYDEEQAAANRKLLKDFIHRLPIVQYRWWLDEKLGGFAVFDTQADAKFFQSSVYWCKVPHDVVQPSIQPCYLVGQRPSAKQGNTEVLLQPAAVQTYGSESGTNIDAGEVFSATVSTGLLEAAQLVGRKNMNEPYGDEAYAQIFHKGWKKLIITRRSPGSLSFTSRIGGKDKPGMGMKYKKHEAARLTDEEFEGYKVLQHLSDLTAKFGMAATLDKLIKDRQLLAAEHPLDAAAAEGAE